MSSNRSRGFTIVEVMMVILIVGLLAALLTNALQSSREMARRTQCLHKMREVGDAAIAYETRHHGYPGWNHVIEGSGPNPPKYQHSWVFPLLPGLGRNDMTDPTLPPVSLRDLLVCPSDAQKMSAGPSGFPPTSIVCNAGRQDAVMGTYNAAIYPADWRTNAVFVNRQNRDSGGGLVKVDATDSSYIDSLGDGVSVTLLLTENSEAGSWYSTTADETINSVVFWPPDGSGSPPKSVHRINGPLVGVTTLYDTARPSSSHPGGVNMFFCDGHGRFVRQGMAYPIYCALMTPNGSKAMDPGGITPSVGPIRNQPQIKLDDLQ